MNLDKLWARMPKNWRTYSVWIVYANEMEKVK